MNRTADTLRHILVAAAALSLLPLGMWIASQHGLIARSPAAMASCLYLLVDSLPAVALWWLGAAGLGYLVRRALLPGTRYGLVLQCSAGLAAMLTLDWALAMAGLMGPWVAWMTCSCGGLALVWQLTNRHLRDPFRIENWPNPPWTLLPALLIAGLYLVAASCPPGTLWAVESFGSSVQFHHLQLPSEWLITGAMGPRGHNVHSYLPNLVEAGYMQLSAMRGSAYQAIYTAQFWHASTALLAAACIACVVSRFVGAAMGVAAAAVFLGVPWTLIAGSMAYTDIAAIALVGGAMLLATDPEAARLRGALFLGMLLGAATLANVTTGLMLAPPIVAAFVAGRLHAPAWAPVMTPRQRAGLLAATLMALGLTLSPWLIRNALWTGNPVFPAATSWLGAGHWRPEFGQRWDAAHWPDGSLAHRAGLLVDRWLLSPGFGAVGLAAASADAAGGFAPVRGLPVLWMATLGAVGVLLPWSGGRRLAVSLLGMVLWPLLVWAMATSMQARLLMPTVLPACIVLGLAMGRLEQAAGRRWRWAGAGAAMLLCLTMLYASLTALWTQTRSIPQGQAQVRLEPWEIVDSLARPQEMARATIDTTLLGDHPVNHLPREARVYLLADLQQLLYIRREFRYQTPFDADPLCDLVAQYPDRPETVTAALKQAGVTHVWVGWVELERIQRAYHACPELTPQRLHALLGPWPIVRDYGWATLYRLP